MAKIDSSSEARSSTRTGATVVQTSPDGLRQLGVLKFSSTFGQIVSVLLRMPHHRHAFLADLEWLVLPAIATNQVVILDAPATSNVMSGPAAAVLYATVSPEVDQRLSANPGNRVRLRPEEWKSGNIAWLVEAAGEPAAVDTLIRMLLDQRFKADGIKTYSPRPDGKPIVGVLRASGERFANAPTVAA